VIMQFVNAVTSKNAVIMQFVNAAARAQVHRRTKGRSRIA